MRVEHARRARAAARDPAAGVAARRRPAARPGRRARLVPVPAPVRRGPRVRPQRGGHAPDRRRGGGRRRRRGVGAARDPGRPDVLRPVRRRHHPGARDRARRGAGREPARRGSRWASSSPPHACATRSRRARSPGSPHGTPATAPARWSGSACRTTSAAATPPSSPRAFAIARRAGLASVPHGGELLGPAHVEDVRRRTCTPDRLGHGVRTRGGPATCSTRSSPRGVALEVCPASNVSLGVYPAAAVRAAAHARRRRCAGRARRRRPAAVPLAPASRSTRSRATCTGSTTTALADLARASIRASRASRHGRRTRLLAGVDAWLRDPPD